MTSPSNNKTPNPSNPSALPTRYEIRQLDESHIPWAIAIVAHSNLYHSSVWPLLYPENVTERYTKAFDVMDYLVRLQINSGHSFGVFDTEYVYKREESRAKSGALYFDPSEPSIQGEQGLAAEAKRLLDQFDFPLVSVALSYDGINTLDQEKMGPLIGILPHFADLYHVLAERDPRTKESWGPQAAGEVLMRNATSTRADYEGQGIMGATARWLMREADARGFRGIQIECLADAVTHVWSKPPAPYQGSIVSEFDMGTYRDGEGKLTFEPAKQRATKCFVKLRPMAP